MSKIINNNDSREYEEPEPEPDRYRRLRSEPVFDQRPDTTNRYGRDYQIRAYALIVAGLLLLVGLGFGISGAVDHHGGSSTSASSSDSSRTYIPPATTRKADCSTEVIVAVDTMHNGSGGNGMMDVMYAIGQATPIYSIATNLQGTVITNQIEGGLSAAEDQLLVDSIKACNQAGNPLLSYGQLDSLQQIAYGSDKGVLDDVTHYSNA